MGAGASGAAAAARVKNRVYESNLRMELQFFVVRVWRTEDFVTLGENADIVKVLRGHWHNPHAHEIVEAIEQLPRIAAIEVANRMGNAALLYPDWD